MSDRPRVLLLRGHQATAWNLAPWEALAGRFDIGLLTTRLNRFDIEGLRLEREYARTIGSLLPKRGFSRLVEAAGDRFVGAEEAFARADIVHAEELGYWFSAEAARLKERHDYRLVLTVWETLPLLSTFRNGLARRRRQQTLAAGDQFLPTTERAAQALLMEGVAPERIEVCPPGVDVERFGRARPTHQTSEHIVLSPGRLVWEKGHHDVMRAIAALHSGLVPSPPGVSVRLHVVGSGPERNRLEAYAQELGIGDATSFDVASYDEMPAIYANASCLVLASLPTAACSLYPGDTPRCFWEEQFGLVLAEGMAAGLPILASTSGAIPEVAGDGAEYFAPGDWMELARKLARGPLTRPPGDRIQYPPERVRRYSTEAAAERFAAVYERVLIGRPE